MTSPLRGADGVFANKASKEERRTAEINVPALKRGLGRYLAMRESALKKFAAEEEGQRRRTSIDIPSLSLAAEHTMEKVRDAIDRNELPATLGFALADRMVKVELDAFNKTVSERFGERAFLGNAAKEASGPDFEKAAQGMSPGERQKLAAGWPVMRAGQQLAAQERTQQALKQIEALRQSQRQGQVLK